MTMRNKTIIRLVTVLSPTLVTLVALVATYMVIRMAYTEQFQTEQWPLVVAGMVLSVATGFVAQALQTTREHLARRR